MSVEEKKVVQPPVVPEPSADGAWFYYPGFDSQKGFGTDSMLSSSGHLIPSHYSPIEKENELERFGIQCELIRYYFHLLRNNNSSAQAKNAVKARPEYAKLGNQDLFNIQLDNIEHYLTLPSHEFTADQIDIVYEDAGKKIDKLRADIIEKKTTRTKTLLRIFTGIFATINAFLFLASFAAGIFYTANLPNPSYDLTFLKINWAWPLTILGSIIGLACAAAIWYATYYMAQRTENRIEKIYKRSEAIKGNKYSKEQSIKRKKEFATPPKPSVWGVLVELAPALMIALSTASLYFNPLGFFPSAAALWFAIGFGAFTLITQMYIASSERAATRRADRLKLVIERHKTYSKHPVADYDKEAVKAFKSTWKEKAIAFVLSVFIALISGLVTFTIAGQQYTNFGFGLAFGIGGLAFLSTLFLAWKKITEDANRANRKIAKRIGQEPEKDEQSCLTNNCDSFTQVVKDFFSAFFSFEIIGTVLSVLALITNAYPKIFGIPNSFLPIMGITTLMLAVFWGLPKLSTYLWTERRNEYAQSLELTGGKDSFRYRDASDLEQKRSLGLAFSPYPPKTVPNPTVEPHPERVSVHSLSSTSASS